MPIVVPEDLSATINYFHEAAAGNTINYEISIFRKDGNRRELEISLLKNFARRWITEHVSSKVRVKANYWGVFLWQKSEQNSS